LQRTNDSILDVLLYAQAEQKKGNTIKSIYAYMVSGLKINIGKGLFAKETAKRNKSEQLKKRKLYTRKLWDG
jgi:ribosomal protein S20